MYDRAYWEQLWAKTLRDHPDKVASKQPNATMIAELAELTPGRVLDAGCGHGAEALWLAARGWKVTAVDFSAVALAHGRATADAMAIADCIQWICGDLATWNAPAASFDLVVCLYLHCANGAAEMIQRLANAVAPGGTLFMIGHRQAGDQIQISVDDATAALAGWDFVVAEERPRASSGTEAVIRAKRIA
jgi:2-polyprenyl-3-methyl-5-hydroxy-6-metoxy-1,4-benzoquinol methylase